ncbi:hypothetical protein PN499_25355 [Kamptonema animale CS-326]|nr:hypothetical protein [Kamptonema animale]MDB9514533.1 hypothetical protein [Kamptonema animale CS-326]
MSSIKIDYSLRSPLNIGRYCSMLFENWERYSIYFYNLWSVGYEEK